MKKTVVAPVALAALVGSLALTPVSRADECRRASINGTGVVIENGRPKIDVHIDPGEMCPEE